MSPHFVFGRVIATPGALNAFAATGEKPIYCIVRHMNLDSGSLGVDARRPAPGANEGRVDMAAHTTAVSLRATTL